MPMQTPRYEYIFQGLVPVSIAGLPGLAFSRPKNDKFDLFYIDWPGHFLEFIKYLAFLKVYRRFYNKIKPFFLF